MGKSVNALAEQASQLQESLGTDYKYEVRGMMVMGFEKDEHTRKTHMGKGIIWKKVI